MSDNIQKVQIQTLKTLIKEYGKKDLNPILSYIDTYEKLLEYGRAFIDGRLYRSVDYVVSFGVACGSNHAHRRSILLELHDYGIFTFDGQSNEYKDDNNYQLSHLSFLCDLTILEILIARKFFESNVYRFYSHYKTVNDEFFSNYPKYPYVITVKNGKDTTRVWDLEEEGPYIPLTHIHDGDEDVIDYHRSYNELLRGLCYVQLTSTICNVGGRDFGVDLLLLEALRDIFNNNPPYKNHRRRRHTKRKEQSM